jgi:hypothetical protein
MFLVGCASGALWYFMEKAHKRKVAAAERQFQRTLQMIEMRNKIHPMYKKDE